MRIKISKIVTLALMLFFVFSAEAKLKGLPFVKSYKEYNIAKKNVSSVKYTVHSPITQGETVTPGEVADFIVEIFFDNNGNRIKEIVYHIETKKLELTTTWVYNEKEGTVIQTRTDSRGELMSRTEFFVNYKANTVLARTYENLIDPNTQEIIPNVLRNEELWTDDAKNKKATYKKTHFDMGGTASKQSIKEFSLSKPYTLYTMIDDVTAPVDYTWLPDYNTKLFKAANSKTRKEDIFDGSRFEYKGKKKLLESVKKYSKENSLESTTDYTYNYDKQKNWVEAVQKETGKAIYIIERDIKYN